MWRTGQKPGSLSMSIARIFGRLMDDSWQHALFTQPVLSDLTPDTIREVLRIVTLYGHGVLDDAEDAFYGSLENLVRSHKLGQVA
jgi:hypothetical protein